MSSASDVDADLVADARRLGISQVALRTFLNAGRGVIEPGVERSFHATVKPIGAACNLDCNYCYYLSKEELLGHQSARRMSDQLLERLIVDYIEGQDTKDLHFTWHGGEPTLLGLPFFRRVVALQKRHLPSGRMLTNDLQTNGTLLDDEWCEFLAREGFLVGLSVDGPKPLHDAYRPTKKGRSSFDAVLRGARLLVRHGVTFSTLTTVNRKNARHPLAVYRFLRDELLTPYLQFIPCVEPRGFEQRAPSQLPRHLHVLADSPRIAPDHPLSVVTEWSVAPNDWGSFLSAVFDEWYDNDRGRIRVNLFETMLAQLEGKPAMLCTSSPVCGKNLAVEHDGRVYSCDHYVYPTDELGSISNSNLAGMVFSMQQLEFGLNKFRSLPTECRRCPYLSLCWGECPRTRLLRTRPGEGNLSYLCSGWQRFFEHAVPRARTLLHERSTSAGDTRR